MKKKYFLVILFLVLVMFLSGCVTLVTDEAKVKSVIDEFFLAINDQNWSKAKGYCVYGSDMYYDTCYIEDEINTLQQIYGTATITCSITISNVTVYGSYAEAFFSATIIITAPGYSESDSESGIYYLQKIGNNWKIYGY
jgi:hypothetical protein